MMISYDGLEIVGMKVKPAVKAVQICQTLQKPLEPWRASEVQVPS
jgi:hypothetical protein